VHFLQRGGDVSVKCYKAAISNVMTRKLMNLAQRSFEFLARKQSYLGFCFVEHYLQVTASELVYVL